VLSNESRTMLDISWERVQRFGYLAVSH